ncbi:heavy metal translocating P-type ATPase [Ascidiimonas sp. W6]|uniref:heavy metal translocating P-type ATPase n=1 Tax=Ascidiimonas meishanensis TaxID=3128903 RepID=UPI0030EF141C
MSECYHCGIACNQKEIVFEEKKFCCTGCKTVYEILASNGLTSYYDLENTPGISPKSISDKFDFLENDEIIEKLVEFDDEHTQVVILSIPSIHCSSCIWILENLHQLAVDIVTSQVDFPKKTVRITYHKNKIHLKNLVKLLSSIGYEPYLSLNDVQKNKKSINRGLIYKLGIAGFAFGNVMFLSFPEYFEVEEFWLEQYKHVFRWLMFSFSLPVIFYAASDYFVAAWKGLRHKILNIDVPIAIGIMVLFIRSTTDIILNSGSGFFDSLTGLVFFLLLGRFFQQKTYNYLSFERDYKSYFPIAVTRLNSKNKKEESVQVNDLVKGDHILIRNEELIPTDGILLKGNALIDYSFVTGESQVVEKEKGDYLYAGGRQVSGLIELEVLKEVSQSYLTQLWSNDIFQKDKIATFQNLTNSISKRFTITVLSIATIATIFWLFKDSSMALNVFTAVLIIACPCAIALAAPFTLGNMLRIFGKHKFYLKNASVIERLAAINSIVFDKTGTITTHHKNDISYKGIPLTNEECSLLKSTLRGSGHPLSRQLYNILNANEIITLDEYHEATGQGLEGSVNKHSVRVGNALYVGAKEEKREETSVYVSTDNAYKGKYIFHNIYRDKVSSVFQELAINNSLTILSGDNEGEKERLTHILPSVTNLHFHQKPKDKLNHIKKLQKENRHVMMVGDGLNDAGALAQSTVGIAISEDVNVFSPACDAILDASSFQMLPAFMKASSYAIRVIKWSFLLSIIYNITGLYFAVTGQLQPVIAAILMPLSSISIVIFTTIATNYYERKLKSIQT